jgi:hypothetical protein
MWLSALRGCAVPNWEFGVCLRGKVVWLSRGVPCPSGSVMWLSGSVMWIS